MAQNKIDDNFKQKILALPEKEKDRYVLRLVRKDRLLFEQLEYRLLEEKSDLDLRKEELREQIVNLFAQVLSPKDFYSLSKNIFSQISWHERVTKDSYGEIEIGLELITETIEKNPQFLKSHDLSIRSSNEKVFVSKLNQYFKKSLKMHEDIRFDFKRNFDISLEFFHSFNSYEFRNYSLPNEY